MENVSKQARQLLQSMMKNRNETDYIIYQDHKKLIDNDPLSIEELIALNLIVEDYAHNYRMTSKGLIFLRQYKTFTRQLWLTSFWIPLAIAVIGTAITQCLCSLFA